LVSWSDIFGCHVSAETCWMAHAGVVGGVHCLLA
jgi:hypothetical protein